MTGRAPQMDSDFPLTREMSVLHIRVLWIGLIVLLVSGCGGPPEFHSSIRQSDRTPWTHLDFHNDPDGFQFAIIGDLAGGFRPEVFRKAIRQLNTLQPEFVMSVGDLIDTWDETEDARLSDPNEIESRWNGFLDIIADLEMPFFLVGGNNDFGNVELKSAWLARFGHTYYSFVYHDVLFIVLDSDDPPGSSDGQVSDAQIDWLAANLSRQPSVRWTVLFLHRPMWIDNASEWQRVEKVLGNRPRTVFAGHHHVYKVNMIDGFFYYSLATTGGLSALGGPTDGQFDHLVWATMTDDGPRVTNLMQNGVWGDNPVAEAIGDHELTTMIRQRGLAVALREYERVRREDPAKMLFGDAPMRELGYDLMIQGQLDAALEVLELNVGTYPGSSSAHSVLAEAYNRIGEREKALESCQRALELDPDNAYAASLMAQIAAEEPPAKNMEDDG